jgi:hypothetical protein
MPVNSRSTGHALFLPQSRRISGAGNGNGGLSKLPLLNPPPSSHCWVSDYAGHLGGCLLACAPDLFVLAFEIACMNLPFFVFPSDPWVRSSISFADEQGVPRHFHPINSFFRNFHPPRASVRKCNTVVTPN